MNELKKQPWSARISSETRDRLESHRGRMSVDHDELLKRLLDALDMSISNEASLSLPILSGPRREVQKITNHLQASLDAMVSAICLAEQEVALATSDSHAKIAEISEALQDAVSKNSLLAIDNEKIKEANSSLQKYSDNLAQNLKRLQDTTESLDMLKSSWKDREKEILKKIEALEPIASTVPGLESHLAKAIQEKEKIEMKLTFYEKEILKANTEITKLKNDHDNLDSKYREILMKLSDETTKNKILYAENLNLNAQSEKLHFLFEEVKNNFDLEQKAHFELKHEFAATKARLEAIAHSNQQYQEELILHKNRFEQENLRTDRELNRLHETIERQSQQIQQLILKLGRDDLGVGAG